MFALDVSLDHSCLEFCFDRFEDRLIRIYINRFSNSVTFKSSPTAVYRTNTKNYFKLSSGIVIPLFDDLAFSMNLLFFKRPETNLINFLGKIPRALPRAVQPHITRKLGVKKGGSTSPGTKTQYNTSQVSHFYSFYWKKN